LVLDFWNGFAALENLDAEVDINRAWESIRGNIKISGKARFLWNEEAQAVVERKMLIIIRLKETSQKTMSTGSKQNKLG
jgi:hypothetical protein